MKHKLISNRFWLFVILTSVLMASMWGLNRRIGILRKYLRLVSDINTGGQLSFVPPTYMYSHELSYDKISIGYAEFSNLFESDPRIERNGDLLILEAQDGKIIFWPPIRYDLAYKINTEEVISIVKPAAKGEFPEILEPYFFDTQDPKYRKANDICCEDPYRFNRILSERKPKALASLFFKNIDDLEWYVYELKMKHHSFWDPDAFFFETPSVEGLFKRARPNSDARILTIWDSQRKLQQTIVLQSLRFENKSIIEKFLGTFH